MIAPKLMTHDERISSYIDNEFSAEQEQEFLISLAASEGLRKSFRSELVLKKVLHHDEAAMNPPRKLRGAVFASLGLGAAGLSAPKANATPAAATRGLMKTFFATKLNTLVTVAGLSISALAGYGVHSIISPGTTQVEPAAPVIQMVTPSPQSVPTPIPTPEISTAPLKTEPAHEVSKPIAHVRASHVANIDIPPATEPVSGATGTGAVKMEPPIVEPAH